MQNLAFVGVGVVSRAAAAGKSAVELCAEAVAAAVRDAGLGPGDVDGLIACVPLTEPHIMFAHMVAEHLGWEPAYCTAIANAGVTPIAAARHAGAVLAAGFCRAVVVVEGDARATRLQGDRVAALARAKGWMDEWDDTYGLTTPGKYALVAQRYLAATGCTRFDLAHVVVASRQYAEHSPWAVLNRPLTVDEVLAAPPVSSPLHRYDCCPVVDWAGAYVLAAAERTPRTVHPPVAFLGSGEAHAAFHPTLHPGLRNSAGARAAADAYATAGLAPADIRLAQIFDAFSVAVPLGLEDAEFCPAGAGGRYIRGLLGRRGAGPALNTYGGMLTCGNAHIYMLVEAILQVRGSAGRRQVDTAAPALVLGSGGTFSSACALILGR